MTHETGKANDETTPASTQDAAPEPETTTVPDNGEFPTSPEQTAQRHNEQRIGSEDKHDCLGAGTLEFQAEYGAPGIGQAWRCTDCERTWARIGEYFAPAEAGLHILSPKDIQ